MGDAVNSARGNLSPEEIHKLTHKGSFDALRTGKKAVCHSDNVKDAEQAELVQVNALKIHGITINQSGL